MNEDRRINSHIRKLNVSLTRQEALAVDGAGCHPADILSILIHHRVAVVGPAHTRLVEAEAHHHNFTDRWRGFIRIQSINFS